MSRTFTKYKLAHLLIEWAGTDMGQNDPGIILEH